MSAKVWNVLVIGMRGQDLNYIFGQCVTEKYSDAVKLAREAFKNKLPGYRILRTEAVPLDDEVVISALQRKPL